MCQIKSIEPDIVNETGCLDLDRGPLVALKVSSELAALSVTI